jgi:hypothetical protein
MPDCTPSASLQLILTYVLPPVGALLSATALWVASLARTTSRDARSTSEAAVALSLLDAEPPSRSASATGARGPRKRSTKGITST